MVHKAMWCIGTTHTLDMYMLIVTLDKTSIRVDFKKYYTIYYINLMLFIVSLMNFFKIATFKSAKLGADSSGPVYPATSLQRWPSKALHAEWR
jgi:hypothetical protein